MIARHLRTIATLAAPLALPAERFTGRWKGSDARAQLVFAGSPETGGFLARALMDVERRESIGRLESPLELRGAGFARLVHDAPLAAAEVPPLWQGSLPRATRFRIPAWVSQELRAPEGGALKLPAQIRKEAGRHKRREGYTVEFTTGEPALRQFYAGLYRPYVTARFGRDAVVVDEERFLAVSRSMTLAVLRAHGEWVAGMLYRLAGTTLSLGWFGSVSHPPRSGASEVLDAEVVGMAIRAGARRVIFGHSRPSLADGVVRYKERFGATVRPTRFPQRVVGILVRENTPALVAAVNAARLVAFHGGLQRVWELRSELPASAGSPARAASR